MSRQLEGVALLVAGHAGPGTPALDASGLHTLGQIGEALLATGAAWQIRRLVAAAGERYAADRATLKQQLDELAAQPARVAVLVVLGTVIEIDGAPALVTGPRPRDYPEDATLPIAWIRDRLRAAKAEQVVAVIAATGDGAPEGWLDGLATGSARHLIAAGAAEPRATLADALLTGLCGEAVDPRTGTVTMASLGAHLAARTPSLALQRCEAADTIAQPPPLAGLWDVRRSQLSLRGTRTRTPPAGERGDDLTGTVLPGRFRVDGLVARGTFGAVYRARQLAVERDVALKVLHADIDPSSEDGRLFVHEIRSVGRLDHPNVVRIHQADITHDGRLFFAMELLDGEDLQSLAGKGPVPRSRAVALVRQLLAGLGAAHDAGLVHADVKPANAIVVPRDGEDRVVLVDFGLARLRAPDRPAESAGGTPAFMAPEQLMEGRVDARSDLFSAALVLVHLLTGWRRPNAHTLAPPLDGIDDRDLRAVLARALAVEPGKRYQTAHELASALTGGATPAANPEPSRARPFRHLAPLTETDRDRLHGREDDLAVLTEHALYGRAVIYTAPSGVGKTSILRAGLLPRLEALGVRGVYVRCRGDSVAAVANMIEPETTRICDAIAAHAKRGGKLVLVLDQLETALSEKGASALVREVLRFDAWPPGADVAVVLSVREDYLARLVATSQAQEPNLPIVRLPPLSLDGARAAITSPLAEARLAIEPALLEALLEDLERAAAALGPTMGWGAQRTVYPPHLQLACSVLFEALGSGQTTMSLARYRGLGGFEAIVGEHLERVLDTELADGRDVIARDLFVALVTTAHERAVRSEAELVEVASASHGAREVMAVLEALRARGLLLRVREPGGEPSWELVHDSLVPRVLAWLDRRDLARRRAVELVRYHVRRSRPTAPSLLGRAELREIAPHAAAIDALDAEHREREVAPGTWTPSRLVARSRQVLWRKVATVSGLVVALATVSGVAIYRDRLQEAREAREASLKARDLGRFVLSLQPFDWDAQYKVTHVPAQRGMRWTLHAPDPEDPRQPGPAFVEGQLVRGTPRVEGGALVEQVEARGGPAFLVVERPGCPPSTIPLQRLPGYATREAEPAVFRISVPTCAASRVGMIRLEAGTFIHGGPGEPPSPAALQYPDALPERRVTLPAFWIDRTEVTNAAFEPFASMSEYTGIERPPYPDTPELAVAGEPMMPVTWLDWYDAHAFCQFLGKELPTSEHWTRALRGAETLVDGSPNPYPRRNFPWGPDVVEPGLFSAEAWILPRRVGSLELDASPDGVRDLAGNVQEWTRTQSQEKRFRVARGGNGEASLAELPDYLALDNPRALGFRSYVIGMRCFSNEKPR